MKSSLILSSSIILFSILASCKKDRTCSCTQTYTGATENYEIVKDSTIVGEKEEDAIEICNQGDRPKQTILTESFSIECELR